MSTLNITRNYVQFKAYLLEAELDDIKESIETFLNVTKLEESNFPSAHLRADKIALSAVDNQSIAVVNDLITVKPAGITATFISPSAVTNAKFASQTLLNHKFVARSTGSASIGQIAIGAPVVLFTANTGSFVDTGLSVTITHGTRPINVIANTPQQTIAVDNDANLGYFSNDNVFINPNMVSKMQFCANGTAFDTRWYGDDNHTTPRVGVWGLYGMKTVYLPSSPGTTTFSIKINNFSAADAYIENLQLVAYED